MKYLLDTNICIYALNGRCPDLNNRLFSVDPDNIFVSSITVFELEYGAAKSHWGARTRQAMNAFLANYARLSFTEDDAIHCGRLRASLYAIGKPIGPYDLMIAAQGIARSLTVVTHNVSEFSRVPGIRLEDWT